MRSEQAGLENMGCLFFLGGPAFLGLIGLVARGLRKLGEEREHKHLIHLMVQFTSGADRSAHMAAQIHDLLTTVFIYDSGYDELASAVASFVPGGGAPFHDEIWLSETFRVFLKKHHVIIPEEVRP